VTPPLPSTSDPVLATRYVAALREGGSLPGLVEGDDDGLWVVKFRGAGQAPKSLVAEWLAGELGRALGLPVPEMRRVRIDPDLAMAEPDQEIQDLLRASPGVNLGIDFLPGSLNFDPAAGREVDPALAADTVWFDALVTNVDRRPPNPNLLVWHERLWLIDHGAAFFAHHGDWRLRDATRSPFPMIAGHVLLPAAGPVTEADERLGAALTPETIAAIVDALPDEWLDDEAAATPDERREAYLNYIVGRLEAPRAFADEAERVRRAA
jgi:HipA-like kinase